MLLFDVEQFYKAGAERYKPNRPTQVGQSLNKPGIIVLNGSRRNEADKDEQHNTQA